MRIRITAPGIYGNDGEIAVGTELDMTNEPKDWVGRYTILDGDAPAEAVAITNPAAPADPNDGNNPASASGFTTRDNGGGWWSILDKDGNEVGKKIRKGDAEAFLTLSADDQTAFVASES